jgi:hypothetical protein
LTSAIVINCRFVRTNWEVVGDTYFCELLNNPVIVTPGVAVTTVYGRHHNSSMTHASVTGFFSGSRIIHYIPRGLNDTFPNLTSLFIYEGRIKKLAQEDLQAYSKLRHLSLAFNDIKVLEEDLFKFNNDLEYVTFWKNKIFEVHPTVFDQLSKLTWLDVDNNQCTSGCGTNRTAVLIVIKKIKENCLPYIKDEEELQNIGEREEGGDD